MKNICLFSFLILFLSVFSCVSVQKGSHEPRTEGTRTEGTRTEGTTVQRPEDSVKVQEGSLPKGSVEVQEDKPAVISQLPKDAVEATSKVPEIGTFIMGKGRVGEEKLAFFLVQNSPFARLDYAQVLAGLYIEEASHEGIDHDVAFAQMCLETGFLTFGGLVQPEWNNFCGLGSIGHEQPGLVFPDLRTGVRAHIQHLKAYATSDPLNLSLVDPRYRFVRLGSSPTIEGLAGTWAADRTYSEKIFGILQRLYAFAF